MHCHAVAFEAQRASAHALERLLGSAAWHGLIEQPDLGWARNSLLEICALAAPAELRNLGLPPELPALYLERLLDALQRQGRLGEGTAERERLATRIMGVLTPRPGAVVRRFQAIEAERDSRTATDDFHRLCCTSDYIQTRRVALDERFHADTPYGPLEITINRSKPEKDPADIAAAAGAEAPGYPRCLLCADNVGYPGRPGHPARQNLRVIPLRLGGADWFLQYSPYAYYAEHAIVVQQQHSPIRMGVDTLVELFDFVQRFPHYFVGSNAELPIVGGSILNHHHFQGGGHRFPMWRAPIERAFDCPELPGVEVGVLRWPMSVLRLRSRELAPLVELAGQLMAAWREHSAPGLQILASTELDGVRRQHNTVTPIARRERDRWILELVLRNNRTSLAHPEGIFHPHRELHHIKKENIGLIEVQGLAVLPGRLVVELAEVEALLRGARDSLDEVAALRPHAAWADALQARHGRALSAQGARVVVRAELAQRFVRVLEHAGVFKRDAEGQAGLDRFLMQTGLQPRARVAAAA